MGLLSACMSVNYVHAWYLWRAEEGMQFRAGIWILIGVNESRTSIAPTFTEDGASIIFVLIAQKQCKLYRFHIILYENKSLHISKI